MSSFRKTRAGVRSVLGFEQLEDRTVPAGNVLVAVLDGSLSVQGDDAGNQIWIAGFGPSGVIIRSLDGSTTINGQNAIFVKGIRGGYSINMGGGDDHLLLTGSETRGAQFVSMGDGDDVLSIDDDAPRGTTLINTGNGNDTVSLTNSVFLKSLWLDTGSGDDTVTASMVSSQIFKLTNPSGNDFFDQQGPIIGFQNVVGFTSGARPVPATPTQPTATLTTTASDPTNSTTLNYTVTFSEDVGGFTAAGITVSNGTVGGFTQVNAHTYTFTVTPAGQGAVSVTVAAGVAEDAEGLTNLASNTVSLTFDSLPPAVTVNALTTNDTTPTLTGTVNDSSAKVMVAVNGQALTATVSGNTWSVVVPTALTAGTYTVLATATDLAGNTGAGSGTLVVDTVGPTAPTLNLTAATDSGTVGDLRTDDSSVDLTGTAEAGATVTLYHTTVPGTPGTGTVISQVTAASDGSFTFSDVLLALGPTSFAVNATDAAGNVGATFAQTFTRNAPPTVASPIADQTLSVVAGAQTFDLASVFADAEQVVRLTVAYPNGQTGTLDINMFAQTQATVDNFVSYVNSGAYNGSLFHRLVPGQFLQGGGFTFDQATATFTPITAGSAIANQPSVSSTIGTIAMAKSPGDPNSATDEFFFNLGDNSSNLDNQNGGFTVFGQVMENGLQTLSAITSSLTTFSGAGIPDGTGPFPLSPTANTTNFPQNITNADLAIVTTAAVLPAAQRMTFAVVGNSNPTVATAQITNSGTGTPSILTVNPLVPGTTTITVQATDLDGSVTTTQVNVTVGP
jgi:cyclophilin family peptidyl-prolyl cis-trans isomerase